MFEILYRDETIIAINKPTGFLVHKTSIARGVKEIILQSLRDQIGQKVFPIHRLDRKTSGVLLFALDIESNRSMCALFAERKIKKHYTAIVRGWTDDMDTIDYSLTNDAGKTQDAITRYTRIGKSEIELPYSKFLTSRYSHVNLYPETGRMHQLRKHMAHIRHPILGDRPHGCNKQNRLWKEKFDMEEMMLHAREIRFDHPFTGQSHCIIAPYFDEYLRILHEAGLEP